MNHRPHSSFPHSSAFRSASAHASRASADALSVREGPTLEELLVLEELHLAAVLLVIPKFNAPARLVAFDVELKEQLLARPCQVFLECQVSVCRTAVRRPCQLVGAVQNGDS